MVLLVPAAGPLRSRVLVEMSGCRGGFAARNGGGGLAQKRNRPRVSDDTRGPLRTDGPVTEPSGETCLVSRSVPEDQVIPRLP